MTDTVNVPREPTQEMVDRAQEFWPDIRDMWSAMLAAAPKAEPVSATDDLINGFAAALKSKLNKAAEKYGYNDDWMRPEWREDLVRHLIAHVEKGDPRDVAAYCAFAWHHGWSVKPEAPKVEQVPVGKVVGADFNSMTTTVHWSSWPVKIGTSVYTHPAPASDELLEKMSAENTRLKAALSAAISADNVLSRAVWAEAELDKIATWLWRQGHQLGREVVADTAIVNLARLRDLSTHPGPASDELLEALEIIAHDRNKVARVNDARYIAAHAIAKHKGPQS